MRLRPKGPFVLRRKCLKCILRLFSMVSTAEWFLVHVPTPGELKDLRLEGKVRVMLFCRPSAVGAPWLRRSSERGPLLFLVVR